MGHTLYDLGVIYERRQPVIVFIEGKTEQEFISFFVLVLIFFQLVNFWDHSFAFAETMSIGSKVDTSLAMLRLSCASFPSKQSLTLCRDFVLHQFCPLCS